MRAGPLACGILLIVCMGHLTAQCIVNNPGGSKVNPNRPSDTDTPEAMFSPISLVNQELPGWMCFTVGYRTRFEG